MATEWQDIGITVFLVAAMLLGAKYIKSYYAARIPRWPPLRVLVGWLALCGVVLLIDRYAALGLPAALAPVAVVGGSAALVTLFGVPEIGRARKSPAPPSDPNREKIVPVAKKRRRKR